MQSRDNGQIFIEFDYKFSDYKFLDYEIKDYHHYLRYYWSAGSIRFYPFGGINLRHANSLEWFLASCPFALRKGH